MSIETEGVERARQAQRRRGAPRSSCSTARSADLDAHRRMLAETAAAAARGRSARPTSRARGASRRSRRDAARSTMSRSVTGEGLDELRARIVAALTRAKSCAIRRRSRMCVTWRWSTRRAALSRARTTRCRRDDGRADPGRPRRRAAIARGNHRPPHGRRSAASHLRAGSASGSSPCQTRDAVRGGTRRSRSH